MSKFCNILSLCTMAVLACAGCAAKNDKPTIVPLNTPKAETNELGNANLPTLTPEPTQIPEITPTPNPLYEQFPELKNVVLKTDMDAFRNILWSCSIEEVEEIEGVKAKGDEILVKNVKLYEINADLTYGFKDGQLYTRTFVIDETKTFFTLRHFLQVLYGGAYDFEEDKWYFWLFDDMSITLTNSNPMVCEYRLNDSALDMIDYGGEYVPGVFEAE